MQFRRFSIAATGAILASTIGLHAQDAGVWEARLPGASQFRPTRLSASHDGNVLLFGGAGDDETWEYGRDDNGALRWMLRTPSTAPSPRWYPTFALDPVRQIVTLFGGFQGQPGGAALGDTWEWDGVTWRLVLPSTSPPAGAFRAAAYDAAAAVTIFVDDSSSWAWDGTTWSPRPGHSVFRVHDAVPDPLGAGVLVAAKATAAANVSLYRITGSAAMTPVAGSTSGMATARLATDGSQVMLFDFDGVQIWNGAAWSAKTVLPPLTGSATADGAPDPVGYVAGIGRFVRLTQLGLRASTPASVLRCATWTWSVGDQVWQE